MIEKVFYKGWSNCYRIYNKNVELVIVADVGPRIMHFSYIGSKNQFVEFPEHLGLTGGDNWRIYGGHRLWHSPENLIRTYYPDNESVNVEIQGNTIILNQPVEKTTNIQKAMEISIDDCSDTVTVLHKLRNLGYWDLKFAAWAISAMAPGGISVLKIRNCKPADICTPNLIMSIWPLSSPNDERFFLGNEYIIIKQNCNIENSFKIGVNSDSGWVAYINNGVAFVKRSDFHKGVEYPDFGSSIEMYTCERFSEIETLSPITKVKPGEEICHREDWNLFRVDVKPDEIMDEHVIDSFFVKCLELF